MNVTSDIPLPSGLRGLVDDFLVSVRIGVRRFWRGGEHANAPAGEAGTLLRRLTAILRYALIILALHVTLAPARPRSARAVGVRAFRLRLPAIRLFPRYRVCIDPPQRPQPAAFARARRDPVLTAQRRLDALRRALADPMPLIRRMARRLPTQLMVFGWRPPKRPPPAARRAYWDELVEAWSEARFALGDWRRRTRDSAGLASAS